jgi:alpha-1,2-mannosyltransferase
MKLFSVFVVPLCSLEVRPEKDHAAQIRMMSWLQIRYPEHRQSMRLLLVGGVRNEGDSARVKELKELAESLQVSVSSRPIPVP